MKKILILGCGGFIGRNLAIYFSNDKSVKLYGTYLNKKPKIKKYQTKQIKFIKQIKNKQNI